MGTALTVFLAYVGVGAVVAICTAAAHYWSWGDGEEAILNGLTVGIGWPVVVVAFPSEVIFNLAREVLE